MIVQLCTVYSVLECGCKLHLCCWIGTIKIYVLDGSGEGSACCIAET